MNEIDNADGQDIDAEIAQFQRELGISDDGDAALNSLKPTEAQAGELDAETESDDQNTLQKDSPDKSGSDTQTPAKNGDQKTQDPNKAPEQPPKDPNAKEPSKYEKAREREQRGWKALNEEKQAIAKEREQIAAERKAWADEKAAREAAAKAQNKEPSPEAYEKLAEELEAKGDKSSLNDARIARQLAAQRRKDIEAEKAAPQAQARHGLMPEAEFNEKQRAALAQLVTEIPEIKDANGELNKSVQKMITEEAAVANLVETHPYGMYWVTKYARAERTAARVPDLEKKVSDLNAELQKLRRNTDPIADPMVNPKLDSEETNFEDLPLDKMEAIFKRDLAAAGRL